MSRNVKLRWLSIVLTSMFAIGLAVSQGDHVLGDGIPRPFKARCVCEWDNLEKAFTEDGANFDGFGEGTHLGRILQEGNLFLFPEETDPETGQIPGTGVVTFTSANGDSVTIEYVGLLDPSTGIGVATFEFIGGTGRFTDATGTGELRALIDLTNGFVGAPMTVTLVGELVY